MDGTDPRAMRALTHPLRLDLMELLSAEGPATAAACGRALGVPQANCSFHLRQLAKYGYVQEAAPGADRRERRWQVTVRRIRFGPESDRIVRRELEHLVVEREAQAILDYADHRGDQEPEGSRAGVFAGMAAVTVEEAAELKRKWRELIEPYLVEAQSAGTGSDGAGRQPQRALIRLFMAMTPMASITGTDERETGHGHRD
jgi:DNA-binding transcriptional ArsR family regulator